MLVPHSSPDARTHPEWLNHASRRRERLRLDRDRRTVVLEALVDARWEAALGAARSLWDRPGSHALREIVDARALPLDRERVLPQLRELTARYA